MQFKLTFDFVGMVTFQRAFEKNGFKADVFVFNSGVQATKLFIQDEVIAADLKKKGEGYKMLHVTGVIEEQSSSLRLIPQAVEVVR
jgi:hypothetical protein